MCDPKKHKVFKKNKYIKILVGECLNTSRDVIEANMSRFNEEKGLQAVYRKLNECIALIDELEE